MLYRRRRQRQPFFQLFRILRRRSRRQRRRLKRRVRLRPRRQRLRHHLLPFALFKRLRPVQMSRLSNQRLFFHRRRRSRQFHVSKPAQRPVNAEPELVHVAILHVLQRVLVRTIRFLALAVLCEKPTRGHAGLVELVQEPARVALHAQVSQPVPAHGLTVVFTPALVELGRRGLGLGVVDIELVLEVEIDVEVVHRGRWARARMEIFEGFSESQSRAKRRRIPGAKRMRRGKGLNP